VLPLIAVTILVGGHAGTPVVSLIGNEFKMVYSPFGGRRRIAGTAEFAGPSAAQFGSRWLI
jgi:hypothetical protein